MKSNNILTVTAALIKSDGKYLVGKRKINKSLGGKWEFPGGKLENNETPQECLRRELTEEFGIKTIIGSYVGESQYDYSFGSIRLIAYEVEYISGEFQLIDHDEIKWVSPKNLSDFDLAPADIPLLKYLT